MYFNDLQQSMEGLLQRNIRLVVNDKVLREGRLILYNIKDYHIECIFITKKDQQKVYEIPVPFDITVKPNCVLFDYSNKLISKNNLDNLMLIKMIALGVKKKSKLYDTVLTIEM